MFGNSHNDDNQDLQMPSLADEGVMQDNNAPTLPTMGGQGSPFSMPQAEPTMTSPTVPQPDPVVTPEPQTTTDPSHMISDHGTPDPDPASTGPAPSGDLVDIKQKALQELSPLVAHLDQTPEEKFRTTMMMIQATDDQSLLQAAHDAAKQITDEKVRAQALLDVINEINYFTQNNK